MGAGPWVHEILYCAPDEIRTRTAGILRPVTPTSWSTWACNFFQWVRRDLNSHVFRHQILSLACMPISTTHPFLQCRYRDSNPDCYVTQTYDSYQLVYSGMKHLGCEYPAGILIPHERMLDSQYSQTDLNRHFSSFEAR